MMKLFGTLLSPYTVRVVLVARAKGLDLVPVHPPASGPDRDAFLTVNPGGRVPFLEDGDFHMIESAVIADYLDAVLPGASLWPEDPKARARAALLARLTEDWIGPGLTMTMMAIRNNVPHSRNEGWAKVTRGLDLLSHNRLAKDMWLAGDSFGHADAATIPWLFSAERFDRESGLGSHIAKVHPDIAAYSSRVKETELGARIHRDMTERADQVFPQSIMDGSAPAATERPDAPQEG